MKASKIQGLPKIFSEEDFLSNSKGYLYKKEGIQFFSTNSRDAVELIKHFPNRDKVGLWSTKLTDLQKEELKILGISFIIPFDEVFINTKKIKLECSYKKDKKDDFPYTNFFSPRGFEILDFILKTPSTELLETNAFNFCLENNLVQPKLSKMMSTLKFRSLVDLKKWILDRDINWWMKAFESPRIRKGLTSFNADFKLVVNNGKSLEELVLKIKKHKDWGKIIFPSGIEILKEEAGLRDKNMYLCLQQSDLIKFTSQFDLIPAGVGNTDPKFIISYLKNDPQTEAFFSKDESWDETLGFHFNQLRMAWGIQIEDSRIQECRWEYLKRFLYEIKKRDH